MKFPTLVANNLLNEKFNLPKDFSGDLNIILIPFFERDQLVVDTWVPFLRELIKGHSNINYYELPTVGKGNFFFRKWLDTVMHYGINDNEASSRTITIYEDRFKIAKAIGGEDVDEIYVLLLDKSGEILWLNKGEFSEEKSTELVNLINSQKLA